MPDFRFAVLADVQYADADTKGARRYRDSLDKLKRCAEVLRAENPEFTVQVGDLVDGGLDNLTRILPVWESLPGERKSVLGNHDFCAPREQLLRRLGMPAAAYTFARAGWRFIALDGMHVNDAATLARLKAEGARNAHEWNGGLGAEQREWLRGALAAAHRARERAIVFCHFPVLAESCRPEHLLWDHRETLAALDESPALAAWINGHDHRGGYAVRRGVHYLTLPGMVENEFPGGCAVIDVARRSLMLRAPGETSGRALALR
jgi:hypothetical protein